MGKAAFFSLAHHPLFRRAYALNRSAAMKEFLVALILITPVVVIGYQMGLDAEQVVDGVVRVVRALLDAAS
ncbi:hypothetical protein C9I57_00440 [Trinickia symbiotica]|uniref:Uncharacterized protein n=1 Tax=Trinickia symbiotica TaxID=863227 RepID=A0A2T3Y0K8_9BURK|nr:hypothetical protein C9I57_00440 [Trinickia symbiotica]